jgi:hypothetical protein
MFHFTKNPQRHNPWNKGKPIGKKPPLSLQEIWSIRLRLQTMGKVSDLALFNLAIDSKLRTCEQSSFCWVTPS